MRSQILNRINSFLGIKSCTTGFFEEGITTDERHRNYSKVSNPIYDDIINYTKEYIPEGYILDGVILRDGSWYISCYNEKHKRVMIRISK